MKITELTPEQLAGIEVLSYRDNRTTSPPLEWYQKKVEWDLNFLAAQAVESDAVVLAKRIAALPQEDVAEVKALVDARELARPVEEVGVLVADNPR